MQEVAIVYWVIAYLACWGVDLAVLVARGPLTIDSILKLVIVTVCLVVVLVKAAKVHWLW